MKIFIFLYSNNFMKISKKNEVKKVYELIFEFLFNLDAILLVGIIQDILQTNFNFKFINAE